MKGFAFTLTLAALITACSSPPNKFHDKTITRIYDFADKRMGDSLVQYLKHSNPLYRAEACLAFGSVQDSTFSYWLGNVLLEDTSVLVRANAAYALGQTNGNASVNALIPALVDREPIVMREVLEALGKTVSKADIGYLKRINPNDSIAQEGMAYALYRLGLRGLADSVITAKASEFLKPNYSNNVRLAAAYFFSRGNSSGDSFLTNLIAAAKQDKNVWVRMAAVSGLRKVQSNISQEAIISCLKNDSDYRVRSNALRALQSFKPVDTQLLYAALSDTNVNVGIAASEELKQIVTAQDVNELKEQVKSIQNWRVRANVIESIIQLDTTYLSKAIDLYNRSTNEYEQSWLLTAMAKSPRAIDFIAQQLLAAKQLVIKTSAAQALANLNRSVGASPSLSTKFAEIYKNAIRDGDPGVIGVVANVLSDTTLNYKSIITDFSFLQEAKNNLSLPKDIEALQPLEEAIAYFEGKTKPASPKNPFNHPIAWDAVKDISKNQRVLIRTTKGDITLQLLVEETPGSVVNFVSLVKQNYFNNKFFHRVVPNFVIQTGCNRGDGYGSEDYSIRSEFSRRRYLEGAVGMASAGKDTEGTQWFITHSPTPHLDGRYTIFATVVSGMETVHQIEVGDKIEEVILQK